MKKILLIALVALGVNFANAQTEAGPVVVGLDLIHFGTSPDENDFALTVSVDTMASEAIHVGPIFGINFGSNGDLGVIFGGEGNVDIVGNALQLGARVAIIDPFTDDDKIAVGPQLVSEFGNFRFRVSYMDVAHFQESAQFRDEALLFGFGFKF